MWLMTQIVSLDPCPLDSGVAVDGRTTAVRR